MIVAPELIQYICLVERAKKCIELGIDLAIEVPRPWKRPKGFPLGRLACVNSKGNAVRYVNAKKAYDFLKALEMEASADTVR